MKKLLSLILVCTILFSCMIAMADEEHIAFTASVNQSSSFGSFTDDDIYRYFAEKFNIEYELWPVTSDTWGEKNRAWIYGGSMPDMVVWNALDYSEYLSYIDQGLIAALPDGWETDYPNLYSVFKASGISDYMTIDGKTYALPRTTMYQFSPIAHSISHSTAYYRKDWAKQVGIEIGESVTVDQLAEYVKRCVEANLSGADRTLGISGTAANVLTELMFAYNSGWNTFVKTEAGYEWGPTLSSTFNGLSKIRELYENGVIDPDFYLDAKADAKNKFATGLSAVLFEDGTCVQYLQRKNEMLAAHPEITGNIWDTIGTTTIVDDNGVWNGKESFNYWTLTIFKPDIDEKVQKRILEVLDYVSTKEAQEIINMGIPGKDWTTDGNGEYVNLREVQEDGTYLDIKKVYNSIFFWYVVSVLPDDFQFANPGNDKEVREMVADAYSFRGQFDYLACDPDYEFYTSDAKSQYSINFTDEAVRAILSENAKTQETWQDFIDANRALWEPLLNELNAKYFNK